MHMLIQVEKAHLGLSFSSFLAIFWTTLIPEFEHWPAMEHILVGFVVVLCFDFGTDDYKLPDFDSVDNTFGL